MQIPLTQGKFAIIDSADYPIISKHKWYACKEGPHFYAYTNISLGKNKRKRLAMHRLLMSAPRGMLVDHKNMNGLDNRRDNLRICTASQNCQNRKPLTASSNFKGVSWHKLTGKWQAYIKLHGKRKYLGLFEKEIEAASAYDRAAVKLFGEFAQLNLKKELVA